MKTKSTFILMLLIASIQQLSAQDYLKRPSDESVKKAEEISELFFSNMKKGKNEANADFIVNSIGGSWDQTKKISQKGDYLQKFQIIDLSPDEGGVYGRIVSYDLLEKGFLSGSDRYFRLTYIGYHPNSVLMYEFRYYVKPSGEVRLQYIGWSDKNPFEYMSTSDMMLTKY